jgi:gamma-glutamylcyclotransferase (GGCT)/AIG2-like uncharacterized protein YtfP
MNLSNQIKKKLSQFSDDKIITFMDLRSQMDKEINVDSFRKALHRLHKQGVITINGRGEFIKEEQFKTYIFVYGSLKKGFENHDILSEANYISKAKTLRKFAMYKEENQDYPYIIDDAKHGQNIDGEVYEITRKDILQRVDDFEGAPTYFKHENIFVKTRKGKIKVKTYVLSAPRVPLNQEPLKSWVQHKRKIHMDFNAYYQSILG